MKNKEKVYEFLVQYSKEYGHEEAPKLDTAFLSQQLHMQRSNVSSLLNALVSEGKVKKYKGRPVLYQLVIVEDDTFDQLYGQDTFLKDPIETMKSALNFPDEVKKILIVAKSGSGTITLAHEACLYAYSKRMISQSNMFVYDLEDDSKDNFIIDEEGFYLIKNAQKLSRSKIHDVLNKLKGIVVFQIDDEKAVSLFDDVRFVIHLPELNSLSLKDRFGLIEYFLHDESKRIDDRIIVNAGLMQCLLIYPCEGGIKAMKREIAQGIANAYRREKNHTLTLELSDFSAHVRKGLLQMKDRQDCIEFLANAALFIFDHDTTLQTREKEIQTDIYQIVNEKRTVLAHTINMLETSKLSESVKDYVLSLYDLTQKSSHEHLINDKLEQEVATFMKEAGERLERYYDHEYVLGVALHLQDALVISSDKMLIENAAMMNVIDAFNKEYLLSRKFIRHIEEDSGKKLSLDESLFFTLFLSVFSSGKLEKQVVNLLAMHGTTASAIKDFVLHLMPKSLLYSFDMPVDEDLNESYERLKQLIMSIDQGMGVHVLYDMGSIKVMLNSISEETKIPIRALEIPITLLSMSAIKLSDQGYDLEVIHNRLIDYASTSQTVKAVNEKIIVAFSKVSEHQSLNICRRLKALPGAKDYEIYYFEADSAKAFVEQLDSLTMVGNLIAIVGTFDPQLFNIRYIEASRLDEVSEMSELLEVEEEGAFDILGYLESQFEAFRREDLEQTVVPFMEEYQKILDVHLDEDAYVGMMVHMACLIDRLMKNKTPIVNFDSDKIIEKYPQETRLLTKALEPIEKHFHVSFLEGDVATLISIVKR